jgi:hypothetical protein
MSSNQKTGKNGRKRPQRTGKKPGNKTRAPAQQRPPRRKAIRSARPRSNPLDNAPLAVSRNRRSTISYSTVSNKGRNAMRVHACVPFCEIGNDPFLNGFFVQTTITGALPAISINVNPYELPTVVQALTGATTSGSIGSWISPHIPLLALAFDRYAVQSLEFSYEPQSTATTADRLVFAWTDDPCHPFLSAYSNLIADAPPTQLELLVTQDSVAFMPWKAWTLKVPVSTDERFMYPVAETDGKTPSARFSDFGAMNCVASATVDAPVQYGILYCSMVIDFLDPVPIVTSVNSLLTALHEQRKKHNLRMRPSKVLLPPDKTPDPSTESKLPLLFNEPEDDSVLLPVPLVRTSASFREPNPLPLPPNVPTSKVPSRK